MRLYLTQDLSLLHSSLSTETERYNDGCLSTVLIWCLLISNEIMNVVCYYELLWALWIQNSSLFLRTTAKQSRLEPFAFRFLLGFTIKQLLYFKFPLFFCTFLSFFVRLFIFIFYSSQLAFIKLYLHLSRKIKQKRFLAPLCKEWELLGCISWRHPNSHRRVPRLKSLFVTL